MQLKKVILHLFPSIAEPKLNMNKTGLFQFDFNNCTAAEYHRPRPLPVNGF